MKCSLRSVAFATTLTLVCLISPPVFAEELTHEALVARLRSEIQLLQTPEFKSYSIVRHVQGEDGPAFQAIPSNKPGSVSDWERGHFIFILKSGEKVTGQVETVTASPSHLSAAPSDPRTSPDLTVIGSVTLKRGEAGPDLEIQASSIAYAIQIGGLDLVSHGVSWSRENTKPEWYFRNFDERKIRARIQELSLGAEIDWEPFGEELLDWLTSFDEKLSNRRYERSYLGQSTLPLYHFIFTEAVKAMIAANRVEDWTFLKSRYWKPKLERVIRSLTSQGAAMTSLARAVRDSANDTLKEVVRLLAGSQHLSSAAASNKLNGLLEFDREFDLTHGVDFISDAIQGPKSTRRTEALRILIQLVDRLEPTQSASTGHANRVSTQARATLAGVFTLCALTLRDSAPPVRGATRK